MKPKQWKQCGRKKSYQTRRAANKAIEKLMASPKPRDAHLLNAYDCPHCFCFHVGHRPGSRRR